MLHLLLLILFSSSCSAFVHSTSPNLHVVTSNAYDLSVSKGTGVYFLSSGSESDLRQITVKANKSNIDTNVFALAVPQTDGSLAPLMITADGDTLVVTRPEGNLAQVSLYKNPNPQNVNVFPMFTKSRIQFKSGINVFFNVDKPANMILTLKNLRITGNTRVVASSGVIGEATSRSFFDSDAYPTNSFYEKLNIPLAIFNLAQIDSGVSYEVSFDQASTSLDQSGVLMTNDYPLNLFPSDIVYSLKSNGEEIGLLMKPFFYDSISYDTQITVFFKEGLNQGHDFPSIGDSRMSTTGVITEVEVNAGGPYAIQYYSSLKSSSQSTTPSVQTTTRSSSGFKIVLSIISFFIAHFV